MRVRRCSRIVVWLLLAAWLSGCAGLYFHEAGPPPSSPPRSLDQWPYRDSWAGIVFNGARIGFSHLAIAPAADAPGHYDIHSEAVFALHLLGLEKKFTLKARDRVNADLTLVAFDYDYDLDGSRQTVRGEVRENRLAVEVRVRGREEHQEFALAAPVYPTSALNLYPVLRGLEVGRELRYTVFDGELRTLAEVEQRVEGYERSELFRGPAWRLRTRLHGHDADAWIDADGQPVFELALNGVLISALEDEASARRYLAQASLNKQETLLDFSLVRTETPIPAPRARRMLEVAFTGLDAARLPPADAFQACAAESGETRCRIRRIAPAELEPATPPASAARYLEPTLAAPSVEPRIRDTATRITAGAATDLEKISRLVAWIQANIRREPVDVFSALDALEQKAAECQGHAYLYAAFARAAGIPTRVVNGLVYVEEARGFLYHTWNESLVGGAWLPVDPTLGQVGVDATHVKLVEGESNAELAPLIDVIGRIRARVIGYE